jgi:formylglycine-generating enzyme required for sulfatase activity
MRLSNGKRQFTLHLGVLAVLTLLCGSAVQAQPPKLMDGPLDMKFVLLPKGTFYMGWVNEKSRVREMDWIPDGWKPKKTEIKADFEIGVYTVTQEQWETLMGYNPSAFSRAGESKEKVKEIKDEDLKQFPVEKVSWEDAQKFIAKLNEQEKGKRLVVPLANLGRMGICLSRWSLDGGRLFVRLLLRQADQ